MTEDSKLPIPPPATPAFRPEMAFPCLAEEMIERLHGYGREETLAPETVLFARGQREVDMFVVLDGELAIYSQDEKNERRLLATLCEGQFTGELDLLSSRRTLVDGCTLTKCVLLRIPRSELQRLMRSEGDIANLIMQATIWRRIGIIEDGSGIVLLGRSTAAETISLQRFLIRNGYPHRLIEPTAEQSANGETEKYSAENQSENHSGEEYLLPAIIFTDGLRPLSTWSTRLGFVPLSFPRKAA